MRNQHNFDPNFAGRFGEFDGPRRFGREDGPGFGGPPFGGPPFGGRGRGRGGGPGRGRGGRGRVGRGQIRTALLALLEGESMHGYEMIRQLDERSGGRWKPSPGAVYPTLQQLTDEGLVSVVEDGGKRIFSLTPEGQTVVDGLDDNDREPWEADGDMHPAFELRGLVHQLGMATRGLAMTGSPEQLERAKAILTTARRSLYAILAEDPESNLPDTSTDESDDA